MNMCILFDFLQESSRGGSWEALWVESYNQLYNLVLCCQITFYIWMGKKENESMKYKKQSSYTVLNAKLCLIKGNSEGILAR